ncbi:MAG: glycosyltransferase [Clostridium sp.]|nr:glycosyltransferase [Clostridium sp.]
MKLSIAMIVKNEEKYIENTLKPLKKLQEYIESEIIIVDTGSTDNTVAIAKKYTDKIYFHKWNNNFGDMRNISIKYCTGDWILVIDADEVLYNVEDLADLIKNNKLNKYNGALIKITNFKKTIENSISNGNICPLLRIFRNGTVGYEGSIHEQPKFKYPITDTNIRLIHYGYDNNNYELMEYKFKRNLNLLLVELEKDPNNIYVLFQIAVSYYMHRDLKEALKYIKMAYDEAGKDINNYIYVIDKYCFILYDLKEYYTLLKMAIEGLKSCRDFIDFYFYMGESYYNLNDYDNAIETYKKYLYYYGELKSNLTISNTTLSINTLGLKDIVIYNLSMCYYKKNLKEEALENILKIEDKDMLKEKAFVILKFITEGKQWNKLKSFNQFIDKYNYEKLLVYIHKEVTLEDLVCLNKFANEGLLKEIIHVVKCFKEKGNLDKEVTTFIKNIINRDKNPYSIYVYYILKHDICEIRNFMIYGRDKMENILENLCINYYDFNSNVLKGLEKLNSLNITDISIKASMEKALLLSGNLPNYNKKQLFLDYLSDRYCCILKTYNKELIEKYFWIMPEEDRFVLQLKDVMRYKYKNVIEYIKSMRELVAIEPLYVEYIKILTEDVEEPVNKDIKSLIPSLLQSINKLLNNEKYQEAYDTIVQALSLINFDFELMMLKLKILIKFNYTKEALDCLKQIILYGEIEKVNKIIEKYF